MNPNSAITYMNQFQPVFNLIMNNTTGKVLKMETKHAVSVF
jgi:hypothetical protein